MTNIVPTPQKNPISAMQQKPIDADVMELVKNKGKPKNPPEVEKAKQQLLQVITTQKIDPQSLIQAGKMAQAALKNKEMYPMAIDMAIKQGFIKPQDVSKNGIDYKLLATGITAGKLTQQLVDEGKI